jgi:hypothetical protein
MATGSLRKTPQSLTNFTASSRMNQGLVYKRLDTVYTFYKCRGHAAMKNKYVISLFLLAMGLGIAFVVTAASVASSAVN